MSINGLVESLMEELNCKVVFTIPLLSGIDVMESMAMTWIIMATMMVASLVPVHGLKARNMSKKQTTSESGMSLICDFPEGLLGKEGKNYMPCLTIVVIYIGIANTIGSLGLKPPIKDLNVTVPLAVMSTVLVEVAGIRKKGVKGWIKSFAEPIVIIAPIDVLELFIWPLPPCTRLFGNMLGAIVVMVLIKYLLLLIVPLPFSFYFDIFDGVTQAYASVFLTSLYIKEAIKD